MAGETGRLNTDQLFKGLTRTPTIFGVSYLIFFANMLASTIIFLVTDRVKVVALMIPTLHIIGFYITMTEPLLIELLMVKVSNFSSCKNSFYHRANSYDFL